MRPIDTIIVHCSASPDNLDVGVKEIREWHIKRGWSDIGYHYVIRRSGKIETGRDEKRVGAHCEGANKTSIGICVVGLNKFEPAQFDALRTKINELLKKYPGCVVHEHRWYPSAKRQGKTCPNFDLNQVL